MHEQIKKEMVEAMKAKDAVRLQVLRALLSSFTNELVSQKKMPSEKLSDDDVMKMIKRAVKQRQDSIEQFTKGNRPELAEVEQAELDILDTYLPDMMSKEKVQEVVEAKAKELGVTEKKDMGKLMGAVIAETKGQADGKDIKEVVDALLS